jgi:hypothetical protein
MTEQPTSNCKLEEQPSLAPATGYAALDIARDQKIKECLMSLAAWATKRAAEEHKATTTLSMLRARVKIIEYQVDNAGLRAENLKHRPRHTLARHNVES